MPLYNFKCTTCGAKVKKILSPEESKLERSCPKDQGVLVRDDGSPSFVVKEIIDNGNQARRIEQYAGQPEMMEEREHLSKIDRFDDDL